MKKTRQLQPPTCDSCLFWARASKELGTCHHLPPQTEGPHTVWPITANHDWCGKHSSWTKWWLSQPIEENK